MFWMLLLDCRHFNRVLIEVETIADIHVGEDVS